MDSRKIFEALEKCADDSVSINSIDLNRLESAKHAKAFFGFIRLIAPRGIEKGLYLTLYSSVPRHMGLLDAMSALNGTFIDGIGFQDDSQVIFLIQLK